MSVNYIYRNLHYLNSKQTALYRVANYPIINFEINTTDSPVKKIVYLSIITIRRVIIEIIITYRNNLIE